MFMLILCSEILDLCTRKCKIMWGIVWWKAELRQYWEYCASVRVTNTNTQHWHFNLDRESPERCTAANFAESTFQESLVCLVWTSPSPAKSKPSEYQSMLGFPRSLAGKSSGGCCGGAAALLGRFPPGGDVFCQIILLYRFITAIKAKPSLTMHQIQGNSLKVHSEPVSTAVCLSIHDWRRVIAFGKLAGGGE